MQAKVERLEAIKAEVESVKKSMRKFVLVQKPGFDHLEVYSANPKINSIVRTLCALYGKKGLIQSTMKWIQSEEGQELSADECWELYQSVRATVKWEAN